MKEGVVSSIPKEITFGSLWKQTWERMRGNWGKLILAGLIQILIVSGANFIPVLCFVSGLLLFPLTVGLMKCSLCVAQQKEWEIEQLFDPFNEYFRMLWGLIRMTLVIFLFYLLLILPGIIAGLAYAVTYYVMLEEKDLPVKECMRKSAFLMKGYKWKLFLYGFLFSCIGAVVTICTLGIGLIFLIPFAGVFMANFYVEIKAGKEPDPGLLPPPENKSPEGAEKRPDTPETSDAPGEKTPFPAEQ